MLWWTGVAAAATSAGVGAALLYRARPRAPAPELDTAPGQVPPEPVEGVFVPQIPPHLREELCRQWRVGNERPAWRPELHDVVRTAVQVQIEATPAPWTSIEELHTQSFRIARNALRSVCPEVPLPATQQDVERLSDESFYWDELWERFYSVAYGRLSGQKT